MKKKIVDAVIQHGAVSFLTLSNIPGFAGDMDLELVSAKGSNIFIWFNCSDEAIKAMTELKEARIIDYRSVSPKEYFLLGSIPKIKSVVSIRHYRTPRWFPVAVAPGPELLRRDSSGLGFS